MGAIPVNIFSLQNVVTLLNPPTDDLVSCFNESVPQCFDTDYEGAEDRLSNFRNYDSGYNFLFNSYINWYVDDFDEDNQEIYFRALNEGTQRDNLSSTLYWEARDGAETVIDSGSVVSGVLNSGQDSHPVGFYTYPAWDSIYGKPTGGAWSQLW